MLFILGWLGLWGEHIGLLGTKYGPTIFAASNVVVFTTALILCVRTLNQLDARRAEATAARRRTDEDSTGRAQEVERRFRFLSRIEFHRLSGRRSQTARSTITINAGSTTLA